MENLKELNQEELLESNGGFWWGVVAGVVGAAIYDLIDNPSRAMNALTSGIQKGFEDANGNSYY